MPVARDCGEQSADGRPGGAAVAGAALAAGAVIGTAARPAMGTPCTP